MYRVLSATLTIVMVAAALVLVSTTAFAHEARTLGDYKVEVGWLNEPAYVGQLNSLSLEVVDGRTNQPVTGVEKTISAEVSAGGLAPFKLEVGTTANPGVYNGWVVPTVTGVYTFHLTGKIGTRTVDEKFTSGPNTFEDVGDIAAFQYPVKVPVADDLGKNLDAISSTADQARVLAIVALLVGAAGLGAALVGRRRA